MKATKDNVFLTIVHSGMRNGKFDAWPENIPLGHLSNDEIIKFHQKLDTTPIPKNSCLYNMYIQFFKKYITNGMSNEKPLEWGRRFEYRLYLEYCDPGKYGKCDLSYNPLAHCFANIRDGLCKDQYAIEIFKRFFPGQYCTERK